jgi:hypothetical protein
MRVKQEESTEAREDGSKKGFRGVTHFRAAREDLRAREDFRGSKERAAREDFRASLEQERAREGKGLQQERTLGAAREGSKRGLQGRTSVKQKEKFSNLWFSIRSMSP